MKTRFSGMLAVVSLACLSSVAANASDICTDASTSITVITATAITGNDQLITGSGSCSMSGYTFSNFDIYTQNGFLTSGETITLTVTVDDPFSGVLALAYNVTGGSGNVGDDFLLTYTITSGVSSMTLIDGTSASITENVCSALFGGGPSYGITSACGPGDQLNTSSLVVTNPGTSIASSPVNLAPSDIVVKDIEGGSESYQEVVPEPMTLSLLGAGLLGLGLMGRGRLRK